MKRRLVFLLKLLVSLGLLVLLARSLDLKQTLVLLKSVPASAWIINVGLLGLATALGAFRWHLATARQIPLRTCMNYYWMGIFYSYVLPGALVGDVARTAALAVNAPQHRNISLIISAFLDRLGGLTSTLLILLLACTGMYWTSVNQTLLVLLVLLTFAILAVFPPLTHAILRRLVTVSWLPARLRKLLGDAVTAVGAVTLGIWWQILGLSLIIHIITCGSYAWGARVTGVPGELWRVALYYAVFNLAMMLPITIAGVGLREQCAVWLFGREGAAGIASVALSWFVLATTLVHVLIGALLHLKQMFASRQGDGPPESRNLRKED
jgi:uncharacterized membrane protein YbhN (UPF0104 family)